MSALAEARLSALDHVLDAEPVTESLADELFSVVDALSAQPALRRALTDPGTPEDARAQVVQALFAGRVSDAAVAVVAGAARLRWTTAGAMASAIEREAVRALLTVARTNGTLDTVEDELFSVGRVVDAHRELRAALADRRSPLEGRQQLLASLIDTRVSPVVSRLAKRAVVARARTFDLTLEGYLKAAAQLRKRAVATVETAIPLSEAQADRLRAALSAQIGREVALQIVVDPSVLGGIRVSMGDEVIEGTVAGRLADAERRLS